MICFEHRESEGSSGAHPSHGPPRASARPFAVRVSAKFVLSVFTHHPSHTETLWLEHGLQSSLSRKHDLPAAVVHGVVLGLSRLHPRSPGHVANGLAHMPVGSGPPGTTRAESVAPLESGGLRMGGLRMEGRRMVWKRLWRRLAARRDGLSADGCWRWI